jgi:hypothetical protein
MVIDDGCAHGGFSIRLFRSRQPADQRTQYDAYIGITSYAPLPVKHQK